MKLIKLSVGIFLVMSVVGASIAEEKNVTVETTTETKKTVVTTKAPDKTEEVKKEDTEEGHSIAHKVLLYLPNRVFDLFDIFRVRAKVGPGLAAGVRATKVAQVYVGTQASVYAGLPGPRQERTIPLPVGLESHNGASVSVVDATVDGGIGPDYSPTEIGASIHPLIFGIDIGFDPVEVVDFGVGLLGFDIRDDDL